MRGGSHERAGGRERSRRRRLLGMGRGACFGKVRLRKGRGSGGERNGGRGRGAAGTGAQGDGRTDVKARDGGRQGVGHVARWTWASAAYGRGDRCRRCRRVLTHTAPPCRCTAGLKQGPNSSIRTVSVEFPENSAKNRGKSEFSWVGFPPATHFWNPAPKKSLTPG
jgi:hypothetical protein